MLIIVQAPADLKHALSISKAHFGKKIHLCIVNVKAIYDFVKKIPLDRILVETDSPWLAPVPYRGKQNEPKNVYEVAECVAEIKGISIDELAEITTNNFFKLFNITQS